MAGNTNRPDLDSLLETIDKQLLLKLLDSLIAEQKLNLTGDKE